MRKRSKKGNTLIELIGAMAILVIGLSGSSFAVSTSVKLWQVDNKKLDLSTFNQSISQNFKGNGETEVERIFTNNPHPSGILNYYFYFKDVNSVTNSINSALSTVTPQPIIVASHLTKGECISLFPGGDKYYGALVSIQDVKKPTDYYSIYKIDLRVWNLKDSGEISATSTFYIGG